MKTTSLKSLFRNLVAAPQAKSAAVASVMSAPRQIDAAVLRQVSGGVTVDLPKRGWKD